MIKKEKTVTVSEQSQQSLGDWGLYGNLDDVHADWQVLSLEEDGLKFKYST